MPAVMKAACMAAIRALGVCGIFVPSRAGFALTFLNHAKSMVAMDMQSWRHHDLAVQSLICMNRIVLVLSWEPMSYQLEDLDPSRSIL